MNTFRQIHLPTLPQTELRPTSDPFCAYSQKSFRLPNFIAMDWKSVTYSRTAPGRIDPEFKGYHVSLDVEHILETEGYSIGAEKPLANWDRTSALWIDYNNAVIEAMKLRVQPGDLIGHIAGLCSEQVKDAFPNNLHVEWGIGYQGVMSGTFKAFESNAWRSVVMGPNANMGPNQWASFYDVVIPNCFNRSEFLDAREAEGYALYMGRLQPNKGAAIVHDVMAQFPEMPLKIAGQGDPTLYGPTAEHLGVVRGRQKAELLAGASFVFSPSLYLEPFAGVHVEALMSGAPVLSTDWGVYPETVRHGRDGYRCDTLEDYVGSILQLTLAENLLKRQNRQQRAFMRWDEGAASIYYTTWLDKIWHLARGIGWGHLP